MLKPYDSDKVQLIFHGHKARHAEVNCSPLNVKFREYGLKSDDPVSCIVLENKPRHQNSKVYIIVQLHCLVNLWAVYPVVSFYIHTVNEV